MLKNRKNNIKVRYENFGGIIGIEKPPALVFVDKSFMKNLGFSNSELWNKKDKRLSAPTEIHLALTGKCNQSCSYCYMSSGPDLKYEEMSFDEIKRFIDMVSDMGVFHIALGGGESFLRDDLFEIAEYIRKKGMVPNLTTNGSIMNETLAEKSRVFGQINISIDSLDLNSKQPRDYIPVEKIINTIKLLKKHGNRVGINFVVMRKNFEEIEDIVRFAKKMKLADVEFLRLKPQGRGKEVYNLLKCSEEQNKDFFPKLMKLSKKYRINLKIDCSYVPMLCYHNPSKKQFDRFYVKGCYGGDMLAAVDYKGFVSPCSFAEHSSYKIDEFKSAWERDDKFKNFYLWEEKAPEPCRSCPYLSLCRGGCHVVTEYVTGDFYAPDPECPLVVEFKKQSADN